MPASVSHFTMSFFVVPASVSLFTMSVFVAPAYVSHFTMSLFVVSASVSLFTMSFFVIVSAAISLFTMSFFVFQLPQVSLLCLFCCVCCRKSLNYVFIFLLPSAILQRLLLKFVCYSLFCGNVFFCNFSLNVHHVIMFSVLCAAVVSHVTKPSILKESESVVSWLCKRLVYINLTCVSE